MQSMKKLVIRTFETGCISPFTGASFNLSAATHCLRSLACSVIKGTIWFEWPSTSSSHIRRRWRLPEHSRPRRIALQAFQDDDVQTSEDTTCFEYFGYSNKVR